MTHEGMTYEKSYYMQLWVSKDASGPQQCRIKRKMAVDNDFKAKILKLLNLKLSFIFRRILLSPFYNWSDGCIVDYKYLYESFIQWGKNVFLHFENSDTPQCSMPWYCPPYLLCPVLYIIVAPVAQPPPCLPQYSPILCTGPTAGGCYV